MGTGQQAGMLAQEEVVRRWPLTQGEIQEFGDSREGVVWVSLDFW